MGRKAILSKQEKESNRFEVPRSERNSVDCLLKKVQKDKSLKRNIILWVGSRAGDYKNIDFIGPQGTIATRFGKDTINIAANYDLFSAEERTKTREDSGMEQIEPFLKEFLRHYGDKPISIIAYHSTKQLEELVNEFPRVKILNPPYALKEKLDDKSFTRSELNKVGVKTVPSYSSRLKEKDFEIMEAELGLPFFLQMDIAWSGFGSHIIKGKDDFGKVLKEKEGEGVSYMPLIRNAKSLNINAVRTANFNVYRGLSFQIIGDKGCISNPFGYCGNDFNISGKLSEEELEKTRDSLEKIGNWMGTQGYRGLYGVDLMSDGKDVYFTEINPRFQGSTSLFIDQQMENGEVPLTMFHLTGYLKGFSLEPRNLDKYNSLETTLGVSQILLHNLSGRDVNLVSSPEAGRYTLENDKLKYLGSANFLSERHSDEEFVLAGDVPMEGTKVLGASDEMCKIFMKGPVLESDGRTLNNRSKYIARELYSRFIFEE